MCIRASEEIFAGAQRWAKKNEETNENGQNQQKQ